MVRNTCQICGCELDSDETYEHDGQLLCENCLDEHTIVCSDCGTRVWEDENEGNSDHPLCSDCYNDDYTHCSRCGALLRLSSANYQDDDDDEDDPYCDSCFYDLPVKSIRGYSYKPAPIFCGDGPRYFGVELEIDGAGESNKNAGRILDISDYIYCKRDGSLNNGFEIVTHPLSLDYHLNQMPWAEILREAVSMGYRSHQANSCGLHIHISRNAFGEEEADQDAAIARILYFVERNWAEILRFSRRTQRSMERWAARYGYKDHPKEILDEAKIGGGQGRYSCVNLQNWSTVEFRMFRGTLKLNTFLATLQFVDRVCDVALYLSDDEMKALSWSEFVAGCTAPELVQYLKERRLYVNDPMDADEEV